MRLIAYRIADIEYSSSQRKAKLVLECGDSYPKDNTRVTIEVEDPDISDFQSLSIGDRYTLDLSRFHSED